VAVLAGVLGAAAGARALVRRAQVPAAGPGKLRRTVGVELAATAVILGMSAVLVQVTPGRSAVAERPAAETGGFSQTLTSKYYTLQFNIYPVELGEWNTVHGMTYTPEGGQLRAPEWTVTTRLLGADLEPVSAPMLPLPGRNDALGSLTFPLPGSYEVSFTIRTSDIDQATVRTTVTVPAATGR
jgi:copper transport protein